MKTKIKSAMMLAASLMLSVQLNAQNWLLLGNSTATASSKLGTTNNIPVRLFTNNAERIHINANVSGKVGYVGIGTTAPAQRLHVVGNGLITGNLGIGVTSPTQKLHVAGSGLFTTGVTASDGGVSGTNTSSTGNGVFGSGYYGVYGSGTNRGVFGTATGFGFGVEGIGFVGLYGSSSIASGDAVRTSATASSCYGVNAYSSLSFGVFGQTGTASSYAGYFVGNVYSSGVYSGSDRKLKQNITDLGNAMGVISKLQPKVYDYRQDGNYKLMNLPVGKHYGLIAQDVEEILPGLVKKTEFNTAKAQPHAAANDAGEIIDFKAVNYTELIPIMIKAMQEQQEQITAHLGKIEKLEVENQQMKQDMQHCCLNHSTGSVKDKVQQPASEKASLEQNAPNPFTEQTVIRYYIPAGNAAVLKIMSLDGKEMHSTAISKTGYGELTFSGSTLAAGTYTYTLIVNGKAIESRIMILSE